MKHAWGIKNLWFNSNRQRNIDKKVQTVLTTEKITYEYVGKTGNIVVQTFFGKWRVKTGELKLLLPF